VVGNGPQLSGAVGAVVVEQGRAAGRERRGVTNKRGRASRRPSVSGGVQEGERRAR
jgi:hypothetical protein